MKKKTKLKNAENNYNLGKKYAELHNVKRALLMT